MRATSSTGEVICLFFVLLYCHTSYHCVYVDLTEQDKSKEDTGSVIVACTDTEGTWSRISHVQDTSTLLFAYVAKRSCFAFVITTYGQRDDARIGRTT